jgi:hypothetical protein
MKIKYLIDGARYCDYNISDFRVSASLSFLEQQGAEAIDQPAKSGFYPGGEG